jgi:hypothetical protein
MKKERKKNIYVETQLEEGKWKEEVMQIEMINK